MAVRKRGRFITLEGGEGTGKSTQAALLTDWLRSHGIPVLLTREPGGSPRAELLRELLLEGAVAEFGSEAEAVVFALARADHLKESVRPALQAGTWVVSDRFLDSTWAYQGASGVSSEKLMQLDAIAVGRDRPDLTLILDLPADIGMERIRSRERSADRFETEALAVHEKRRQAYLDIARREPARCVVIDAGAGEQEVAKAVCVAVTERLDLDDGGSR